MEAEICHRDACCPGGSEAAALLSVSLLATQLDYIFDAFMESGTQFVVSAARALLPSQRFICVLLTRGGDHVSAASLGGL